MTVDKSTQTWHSSVAAKIKIGFEQRCINCFADADAGRAAPFVVARAKDLIFEAVSLQKKDRPSWTL